MKSMHRLFTSTLSACAVAFAMLCISAPAAVASTVPAAASLEAATTAAAPVADHALALAVHEQDAASIALLGSGVRQPMTERNSSVLPAAVVDMASFVRQALSAHADREAVDRTLI